MATVKQVRSANVSRTHYRMNTARLGAAISLVRVEADMTRSDLADAVRCKPHEIIQIEEGDDAADLRPIMDRICKHFGTTSDELLELFEKVLPTDEQGAREKLNVVFGTPPTGQRAMARAARSTAASTRKKVVSAP